MRKKEIAAAIQARMTLAGVPPAIRARAALPRALLKRLHGEDAGQQGENQDAAAEVQGGQQRVPAFLLFRPGLNLGHRRLCFGRPCGRLGDRQRDAGGARHLDGDIAGGQEKAAAEAAAAQMGQRCTLQQARGQGVGNIRLQAVAHLQAHETVVARTDEQQAVVPALGADGEAAEHLFGELLDLQPAQVADRDHGHLDGRFGLQLAADAVDHPEMR